MGAIPPDEERWDCDGFYAKGSVVPLDPDKEVRVIQQHPSGDVCYLQNLWDDEVDGWARLIAAAPDLLRACKASLARSGPDSDALSVQLRAAIARAEGPRPG